METTELAHIVWTVLRDMLARGVRPDEAGLAAGLAASNELNALLNGHGTLEPEHPHIRAAPASGTNTPRFAPKIEHADSWREALTRSFLTLLKLLERPDFHDLDEVLGKFKKALTADTEMTEFKHASEALKDAIIRTELFRTRSRPEPIASETSPPERHLDIDAADQLKEAYLTVLGELDLDFDEDYKKALQIARSKVGRTRGLPELLFMRQEVEIIVRRYALLVYDERTRAADFITLVANRIEELERLIFTSATHVREAVQASRENGEKVQADIAATIHVVQRALDLEKLKKSVLVRLKAMSETLKERQNQELSHLERVGGTVGSFQEKLTEFQEKIRRVQDENKELLKRLQTDCLTGAYNRLLYEEHLAAEFSRFKRYHRSFSILIYDLDKFKSINDKWGHYIGDKCLRELVNNIQPTLRNNDILARYGGDEFIVLLPETNCEQAVVVAEKIRQTVVATEFLVRGEKIPVTISLGVTEVREDDASPEVLFSRADHLLYKAKDAGRNRIQVG